MKLAFLFSVLLALFVVQGCSESSDQRRSETTLTKIRLMGYTMGGNEAEASNGLMALRRDGVKFL